MPGYYVVKIFRDDSSDLPGPNLRVALYLGPRPDAGGPPPYKLGVCSVDQATQFLRKADAKAALIDFFADTSRPSSNSHGQVFYVAEEALEPEVRPGGVPRTLTVKVATPEDDADDELDLDYAERALAAIANPTSVFDHVETEARLFAWLRDNAATLFVKVRERDRLDWLRKNPESCRATHDCRSARKPGFILCERCCENGVGGYFDVYQTFYSQRFTDMLNKISSTLSSVRADVHEHHLRPPIRE